jgi:alkylhydroperoxidase family enzyme
LLVTQLAAERSQCRWCIEQGRHRWREAQLPADLLTALSQYPTSRGFSEREGAALAFADAVTRYADATGGMPPEPLAAVREHFTEPEVAALTEAVASMHYFNPITATPPPVARPSSLRNLWL